MKKYLLPLFFFLVSLLTLVVPKPVLAAENIHIDSAEWLDSEVIRFHYSANTYAPGGISVVFTTSDGSRTYHAGAQDYPTSATTGYVDLDSNGDINTLYWGADAGYTRYYALAGWGDNDNMSNTVRLPAYVAPPEISISASPSAGTHEIGDAFSVDVRIQSQDGAFNAARANLAISSNLTLLNIVTPQSGACNLQYTDSPTVSSPSFAGAIYGGSSTDCTAFTLVLEANEVGTGTVTLSNGSIKSYTDNSEILTGVVNGSFSLVAATPEPTPPVVDFSITNQLKTYLESFTLSGMKFEYVTAISVDGSSTASAYPTSTSWTHPVSLAIGPNEFTVAASVGSTESSSQQVTVTRHTLGDINGDGEVDLIDASLFAVDWDKTSNLTYLLSDMNNDGNVNLTDLSILAKLQ